MKVYSWNVLCNNKKVKELCNFIETLDFDVFCLQELTPEMLAIIKTFPFKLVYHIDVVRTYSKQREENYVAILSKHQIVGHGTFQFPELAVSLRTRLFIHLMRVAKFAFLSGRGGIYADILLNGKKVRIFSVHLILWGPTHRAKEFSIVAKYVDANMPTIIAGDFNVIEYPPMKILTWLLGAPIREAMPYYPERALFEKRFAEHGFRNPLRGKITHDISRSQLDHILISKQFKVLNATVQADAHGSDHHAVGVEIEVV